MKNLVVDASVAIKWFLPEIHSEAASFVLKFKYELWAPELIGAEVGNTLFKKARRREITNKEAEGIFKDFLRLPLQTHSSKALLHSAWRLSHESGCSIYDAMYLALAISRNCDLVTADRKFYESQNKRPASSRLVWVEDIK